MTVAFPQVLVGVPLRYEALSVFPLYSAGAAAVEYSLGDEALSKGDVHVGEVSEAGSVPELLVDNASETRVLFIEGEELVGARQNRVLNTSVLVAARSKTRIPVSCVEHGRWRYKSAAFGHSGHGSSSKLRRALKVSVTKSLLGGRGHRSDQGRVWEEVSRQQESLGVGSATSAMADTYAAHRRRLDDFHSRLPYSEGAIGLAVALGSSVVGLDLFDKPATCQKVWNRLLAGYTLDALETPAGAAEATPADVEAVLIKLQDAAWSPVQAVGDGQEFRAETNEVQLSALCCDGVPVHASLVVGS